MRCVDALGRQPRRRYKLYIILLKFRINGLLSLVIQSSVCFVPPYLQRCALPKMECSMHMQISNL